MARVFHSYEIGREFDITILVPIQYWSIISVIQSCGQLPYKHSNQLGGFWDDYGTINYKDDNWHW
jgi:hypothetical protein